MDNMNMNHKEADLLSQYFHSSLLTRCYSEQAEARPKTAGDSVILILSWIRVTVVSRHLETVWLRGAPKATGGPPDSTMW